MDENEFEFRGVSYIAIEYTGSDCGCEQGKRCAFDDFTFDECSELKCSRDERGDGRNVIFVEKNP